MELAFTEFESWWNFRVTEQLVEHGPAVFFAWYDLRMWYPAGRPVGQTLLPGLHFVAAAVFGAARLAGLPVTLLQVCLLAGPGLAVAAVLLAYLWTGDVAGRGAGLLAAGFLGLVPAFTAHSMAGHYDAEALGLTVLLLVLWLWSRALAAGSVRYAVLAGLGQAALAASWGGAPYGSNLVALHALALLATGRQSPRLYVAYSVFWCLSTLLALHVPALGAAPLLSGEGIGPAAVFVLLQLYPQLGLRPLFAASFAAGVLALAGPALPPRLYALFHFTYAQKALPMLASVAENQPTTWASYFLNLHLLTFLLPLGVLTALREHREAGLLLALFAGTALYFAGVAVRLLLLLAAPMAILGALYLAHLLRLYAPAPAPARKAGPELSPELGLTLRFAAGMLLLFFVLHSTWVTAEAYAAPSHVVNARLFDGSRVRFDDFREAYAWLGANTPPAARVLAWWDYGHPLAALANRTSLVDNASHNASHVALVARALALPEAAAARICRELAVDYVLVVFGGWAGYPADDLNKLPWMLRIAGAADPAIREADYVGPAGEYTVGRAAAPALTDSLLYRLSYYRYGEVYADKAQPGGYDRVRSTDIGRKHFELQHFEEAFTTNHWLVRIYRLLPPHNRA